MENKNNNELFEGDSKAKVVNLKLYDVAYKVAEGVETLARLAISCIFAWHNIFINDAIDVHSKINKQNKQNRQVTNMFGYDTPADLVIDLGKYNRKLREEKKAAKKAKNNTLEQE